MCQPITHYLVAQKGLESVPMLREYDSYLAFGSFGPDLFYLASAYSKHADSIHSKGSYSAFCNMLDIVKQTLSTNEESGRKQLAFALGFYAHVVADCVFHPYVYRRSLDHWTEHDPAFEAVHKEVEAIIDQIIQEEIIGGVVDAPDPLRCSYNGLLDEDIAFLFHQALVGAYPESIAVDLNPYATEESSHPLQIAYQNYCKMPDTLYGIHNVLFRMERFVQGLLPDKTQKHVIEEEKLRHNARRTWPPDDIVSSFSYNHVDMFKMAVNGVQAIGNAVQEFLMNSAEISAAIFFQNSNILYVGQDWNLDTGLPSSKNQNSQLMDKSHARFECGIDILAANYKRLTT